MIRQMVSLLMDNAVKYSNENGEIHCRLTGKSHRFLFQETNTVEVGSILPGPHPEFFHRFYRADTSRNSKAGSFGIGLSVVEAIVKAHKGHVFATSSDGNSVTFQVEL
ncbi:MAG TPA: ATP-binding protein [Lachnospiraceae bacterium]|nr:ATP-binding protein [Lachnospiraceae bacterium]